MEQITDIEQVRKYVGKIVYVEFEWNSYLTMFYYIHNKPMHDGDILWGKYFSASCQVRKDGVHGNYPISERDMKRGTIFIRLATPEEIESIEISYGDYERGIV